MNNQTQNRPQNKHPNPYVQKFSQAFNLGLFYSVFFLMVVLASCQAQPAYSQVQLQGVAAMCSDIQQLRSELDAGSLTLLSISEVQMKGVDGSTIKADKLLVRFQDGLVGTFVVSQAGTTCLLFRDIPNKVVSN